MMLSQKKGNRKVKNDNGNVLNEDGISGRNDVAKAVKRIEKRDQGFAILSQAWEC